MIKAVGTIRGSTEGQVREGYSLAYQRDEIMRYCADNKLLVRRGAGVEGVRGARRADGAVLHREQPGAGAPDVWTARPAPVSGAGDPGIARGDAVL